MTNIIKKTYEKLPKFIKYMFSFIFIRLMVKNPIFKRTWKELDEFEKLSITKQKKVQFEKLKETLIYSYEYVPYYKELFDKYNFNPYKIKKLTDIEVLPILEKEDVIKLDNKIHSTEKGLKYYKTCTGGSSGQSLIVLLDKDSIYKERAVVTHFLSKFGYKPLHTKTVALRGHDLDKNYYYSPLKNEIDISPFRVIKSDNLNNIYKDIKDFKATFLMGYPSALYTFAKMVQKEEKKLNFEHIIYYSENCSEKEKNYIGKTFNCKVGTYYGHTERASFAELYGNNWKFNDYYGYTELIPTAKKNEYRIICTGFMSKKMPLIRYATDDIVKIKNNKIVEIIGHRNGDVYLKSKTNKNISKVDLYMSFEEFKKIKCYQYVQKIKGKAELHIIENEKLNENDIKKLKNYLEKRCEGMLDIDIKIVDKIQLTSSGKYIWAINNIRNN